MPPRVLELDPRLQASVRRYFFCLWAQRAHRIVRLPLKPPVRVSREWGGQRAREMGDVQLACSVPSPTMYVSRLEGVVEGRGPHRGATVVTTSSRWGRGSRCRRPKEPTPVG